jgi:hypothetical protein
VGAFGVPGDGVDAGEVEERSVSSLRALDCSVWKVGEGGGR